MPQETIVLLVGVPQHDRVDHLAANLAPLLLDGTVLPVGVITGALGAPFLLWLLVTANRKEA